MPDTLVIYYSYTHNSEKVANYVAQKSSADILKLEPKEPFSQNYDEVVKEWQNNDLKKDVELIPITTDLNKYSKIILITCTWWYGISPVMKRFLKDYDLAKKDILIASSNAGWLGHSLKDYHALLPNANIKGELDLVFSSQDNQRDKMITTFDEIDNWLKKLN